MPFALYSQKKRFSLLGILTLLIVLTAGFGALIFINESQDSRQQAWVGINDVQDSCVGGNCKEKETSPTVFASRQNIYEVSLADSLWKQAEVPVTADAQNTDASFFVFRNDLGFATLFLNSTSLEEEHKNLDIVQLADKLEDSLQSQAGATYLGKEIVNLGTKTVIRFDFEETILGQKTTYSEYILPGKTHLVEGEARSVGTPVVQAEIHRFLQNIRFIQEGVVKGASTDAFIFAESEITQLVKPSVAHVLHLSCKTLNVSPSIPMVYLQPAYPFCSGGYGSGFVVDGTGLVATNGHVVTSYPEQDIIAGLTSADPAIANFVVDLIREILGTQGIPTTPQEGREVTIRMMQDPSGVQAVVQAIYELLDSGALTVTSLSEKYYVNLGTEPFEFTARNLTPETIATFVKEKTALFPAALSGVDYANLFSKAVIFEKQKPVGSDVAFLRIQGAQEYTYPSLHLGSAQSLKEGDPVLVLGFPGAVSGSEEDVSLLDYASSSTKVTVTRGIVSALKKDSQGNTLIQTDATIGHGNSGGPAFNSRGQVVGIATYGMGDEVGSFNFLRDIADLQNLAQKENLSLESDASITYRNWETALGYYWQNRYTKSLSFLNTVEELYPVHPTAEEVVEDAKQAIKEGKDVDLILGIPKTVVWAIGAVAAASIVGVGVLKVMRRKKSTALGTPVPSPSEIPTGESVESEGSTPSITDSQTQQNSETLEGNKEEQPPVASPPSPQF